MIKLRYYQEAAVGMVRDALEKFLSVILVLATGAGKTVVFSYIARRAAERGARVMILAHRDTLLKQASNKLKDYGVDHGMITPAYTPQLSKRVQVASVQTLVRRLHKWKHRVDLLIIDECHLSAAASYLKVVEHLRKINPKMKIIGVTGSPARLDGKGLGKHHGGLYEELLIGIGIRALIEEYFLVRPAVYAPATRPDLTGVKKVGGDFDAQALAEVMDKPKITGDAIDHYKRICPGVPAVAWCANVAHAEHVAAQFNAAGIPARALSGEDDTAERDKALADLSAGRIKVITFAMLLVEGVDCPAIGAVILLRPTMSLSSYLQVIGRGLRPIFAPGFDLETAQGRLAAIMAGPKGPKCFVLDHAGLTYRHGFADEDREWSLDGVPKKKGGKKKQEEAIDIKQCPKCFIVHPPSPTCPGCGHVYKTKGRSLEHEDGELQEITPEMRKQMAKDKQKEVGRAKTLEALKEIEVARGYKEGWADHIFASRKKKSPSFRRPEPPPEVYDSDLFSPGRVF